MILPHFVIQVCIFGYVSASLSQGTRMVLNKRSVKIRAFNRACKMHSCRNTECTNEDGWGIYGSDLGCCGNYDGCCKTASVVCYLHDVMCKCCNYGWLICGPECRKEPECYNEIENYVDYQSTQDYKLNARNNHQSQNSLYDYQSNDQSQNGIYQTSDNQSVKTTHHQVSNENNTTESNVLSVNETADCVQNGTCTNDSLLRNNTNVTLTQNFNQTSNYNGSDETSTTTKTTTTTITTDTVITEFKSDKSLNGNENITMNVDNKTDSELREDGFMNFHSKYDKKKHRKISNNMVNKLFKTAINKYKFFHPFDFTREDKYGAKREDSEGSGDIE